LNNEDEGEIQHKDPMFKYSDYGRSRTGPDNIIKCSKLVIAMRGPGLCFLYSYIHHSNITKQVVATLQLPEILPKGALTGLHDNNCEIQLLSSDPNILYMLCQYNIPDDRAYIWTATLFNHILPQEVIVLDALPEPLYRTRDIPTLMLLKKLETDANKGSNELLNSIGYLEAPNIIDKTPAAILTYCQLRYKKACLILSLQINQRVEFETIAAYERLLPVIFPSFGNLNNTPNFYNKTLNMYNTTSGNPLFL